MKKKSFSLIVGLMTVALLGVMGMQYYFIRESYQLKTQLFDQSVNEALNAVVSKLEKREALIFLQKKAEERLKHEQEKQSKKEKAEYLSPANQAERFANRLKIRQQKIDRNFKLRDSLLRKKYPTALVIDNNFYETYFRNPEERNKVRLEVKLQQSVDAYGRIFQNEIRELYVENPNEQQKQQLLGNTKSDSVHYLVEDPRKGLQVVSLPIVDKSFTEKLKEEESRQIKKVNRYLDSVKTVKQKSSIFEDLANEYEQSKVPLKERINSRLIDTLLNRELVNRGINLPYNYKVALTTTDSVIFTRVAEPNNNFLPINSYKTALFPKEMVREAGMLTITFPTKSNFMFNNMDAILGSSVGLLVVLIGCFAFTIFTIYRQKKISEMKTDFINNMTHEFKTPVATIMIASEALKDPEVVEDKKRIDRLAHIIYDENVRLGNHIERVLNIAKIDKGDLKLQNETVEMHDLISAVVDSMSLQLQKRDGVVNLKLAASNSCVVGDELHLSNVIFNLLDNAVKYSNNPPEISISTYNSASNFIIEVADKGIGMSKDQLTKIFDQFYRIPTGNVHDVKGFGLGLSYVNKIVKQLQGTIKVVSEKDKGSSFQIVFPSV